jgi:hypothetical protein
MLELLHSRTLWERLARARGRGRVVAVVAYANEDHLKLRAGDTLICDASPARIETGATTHKLLASLAKRGVRLFHLPRLHAKVVRLPGHVVVGSANMTANAQAQIEAALLTDEPEAMQQVDRLLDRLLNRVSLEPIDQCFLDRIAAIEVKRAGGAPGSQRVRTAGASWLIGYGELSDREQVRSDALLTSEFGEQELPDYYRTTLLAARRRAPVQRGDVVFFVDYGELRVRRPVRVTGVVEAGDYVFYLHEDFPDGGVSWDRVRGRLRKLGVYSREGVPTQLALDPDATAAVVSMFRPLNAG